MSHNVDDFRSYQTLYVEHIIPKLGPKTEYLPHKNYTAMQAAPYHAKFLLQHHS